MDKREHVRKLPPLASSEDLSEDLLDSPEADARNKCLEGIVEVSNTPVKSTRQQTICLAMPNTPRIDISRASSSSHHDDSSPERDLFVGESTTTRRDNSSDRVDSAFFITANIVHVKIVVPKQCCYFVIGDINKKKKKKKQ